MRSIGIDLVDLFREESDLSPTEVLWLFNQLPDDSACRRDPTRIGGQFNLQTTLIAEVVNAINDNTFAFIQAHSKKKISRPKRIEAPGAAPQKAGTSRDNPVYIDF